jgi:hypothetical protein
MARIYLVSLLVLALSAHAADAAGPPTNLLANPGFEEPMDGDGELPANWEFFTTRQKAAGVTSSAFCEGAQSLRLAAQEVENAHMGVLQVLPVQQGRPYVFSAEVAQDKADLLRGPFFGVLAIEWLDELGREIDRKVSPAWEAGLSKLRWTRFSVSGRPPRGAAKARFVIHVHDGGGQSGGACLVDNTTLVEK